MEGIPDIFLLWAHRNARFNGTREEASPAAPDGWDTAGQTGGRKGGRRTVPEYTGEGIATYQVRGCAFAV